MPGSKMLVALGALAFPLATTACSAPDRGSDDGTSAADAPAPTREEMDEELARVRQGLDEATCATTAADATLLQGSEADSVTSAYDHTTCRNAFIVDAPGMLVGSPPQKVQLSASATVATVDFFTCLFSYGGLTVYQKQGADYTKIGENYVFGTYGLGRFGFMCSAVSYVTLPGPGDYKVAATGGSLFGAKYAIRVGTWFTQ